MNTDTLLELFQKSYRVTLGAASSAVEAVQDPQRTADEFSEIGTDWVRLADKLEVRGALTEKEARDFVEGVSNQLPEPLRSMSSSFHSPVAHSEPQTVTTVATPVVDTELKAEVESLTAELIAMRAEIESLKQEKN
ncbi:MAG: hypothetical protein WA947_15560 [Phormidesmis sp.]